ADELKMIDARVAFGLDRRAARRSGEPLAVEAGGHPARLVPRGQVAELHTQDRRLERVEPLVVAGPGVQVLLLLADVAQRAQPHRPDLAAGRDRAPLPVGAEVLSRVEREGGQIPERAGGPP